MSFFKFLQVEAGFCKFQRIFANFSESMRDMTCLNMISEKIDQISNTLMTGQHLPYCPIGHFIRLPSCCQDGTAIIIINTESFLGGGCLANLIFGLSKNQSACLSQSYSHAATIYFLKGTNHPAKFTLLGILVGCIFTLGGVGIPSYFKTFLKIYDAMYYLEYMMYSTFFKSHEGSRVKTTLRYFQQSISCHTFFMIVFQYIYIQACIFKKPNSYLLYTLGNSNAE